MVPLWYNSGLDTYSSLAYSFVGLKRRCEIRHVRRVSADDVVEYRRKFASCRFSGDSELPYPRLPVERPMGCELMGV